MDNDLEALEEGYNIDRNIRTVCLVPGDLRQAIADSQEFRFWLEENLSQAFNGKSDDVVRAILECASLDGETLLKDRLLYDRITAIGNCKKTEKSDPAQAAINKIVPRLIGNMLASENSVEIPQSTMDAFLLTVREKYAEAMEGSRTELPANPRRDCSKCDYFYACTAEIIKIDEAVE